MKLVAISDLHGDQIPPADLPDGDVLVIAGDVLADDYHPAGRAIIGTDRVQRQGWFFDEVWAPYLEQLSEKYPHVLWIAGNHDFFFQAISAKRIDEAVTSANVHYLQESFIVLDGVKFYGAPWNMTQGWAFAIDEAEYAVRLGNVPADTDVMIVHGPPAIKGMPGVHWTSEIFGDWLALTPMKAVICGHIHEAYGTYQIGTTPVYVVSSKNRQYELVNLPVEIEI